MKNWISIVTLASILAVICSAQNPAPTTVPNGLPDWAFNIPDKVQPPSRGAQGHGSCSREREGIRRRESRC